jgi:hypothetical protein
VELSVSPCTATIARLLAEEARARWLPLLEDSYRAFDDISCIVLQVDPQQGQKKAGSSIDETATIYSPSAFSPQVNMS